MQKIILDCDPGMDDALAIINAVADRNIELLGLSIVAGNVALHHTRRNALDILHHLGIDLPVYEGAHKPLKRELHIAEEFHGAEGMGDLTLKNSSKDAHRNFGEFYLECARKYPHEVTLVAVGPLTNVAIALREYPELKDLLKEIIFMGGSLCGGNVTPHAEFNIFVDPEAANIVLGSGLPVTMIGLDATLKAKFSREELDELRSNESLYSKFSMEIFDSMFRVRKAIGMDSVVFHDSIGVISSVYGGAFTFENKRILVDEGDRRGETREDEKGFPVEVAMDFDREWFKRYLLEVLK